MMQTPSATRSPLTDLALFQQTTLTFLGQNGVLDPGLVGRDLGVDSGYAGTTAPDTEADDAHLVPLAVLLAD